ncbi:autotransporter-associated beta strand repeat-containing protein [Citrobacter sp. Awk 4]|uniref:autotransporter-associated beta strand repeat-containing protein n=1 Tax=Citrobacter sp. Awk 4 TaxID=2963955 RepID=UPI0023038CB6|nr:autotransporter-associated beta strand repeat-containing protein [Citrobacter sp. Awk 4]MDA8481057.1 autotransporter-associated beta strand repeat-containing protein [Citrobacter sp. Awk 4]
MMNKVFKIVWNASLQCWVVVSEIAKSHGKAKSERRLAKRAGKVAMGVLGGMALLNAASAATLVWSPTGQSSGGSGTWDTTSSAWYNGTITMPWNNAAGDSAWFGGTGGTVTLDGLIKVQDLSFTIDGYTLSGGTLETVSGQSVVNVSSGATATIDSIISGSGLLASTGGGKLILSGVNTYSGGTTVSGGGVLEVSSDSNLGAAAGVLTLGSPSTTGTLNITGAFNGSRNVTINLGGGNINVSPGVTATFNGVLSGNGALGFTGTGTTVLNGANTWTGTATIGAGGTLQVGTGSTTGTLGAGATVNNGVLVFNRSNAYAYSGIISGTGALQNIGSGTTTLSGNNTFTGGVTVSAGKLVLTNANNSTSGATIASGATLELNGGSSSISGNIENNGTLNFSRGAAYNFAGVISGTGTVNQTAGNWLTLSGTNTYSGGTFIGGNGGIIVNNDSNLGAALGGVTFNNGVGYFQAAPTFTTARTFTLNSGTTGYFSSSSGNLTLTSPIVGAGSFGVSGGTVILAGTNNTYTGTTNINAGTLQINDESNLSSNAASGITYTGGGVLRVMSSGALARNIILNANGNIDAYNGATVTVNGTISGGGGAIFYGNGTAGGTVILNGNNTYTGGTWFWTGSKVVAASNSNLGGAAGTWSFSNGTLATTSSFSSSHALSFSAAGTLDVADGTTLTLNGVASGGGRLTKANTGTLVLTGANTWTGGTTITAGTLQIGNGGTSGSLGTGNVTNNGTLAFNRSDITSYNNLISGSGAVAQTGSGSTTLSGNNTYTGATTVSAGTLYVNGNQSSATGLTTVASGATLGGSGTIGGSVTVADGGTLTPGASADTVGTLTIRGNLALSSGAVLNYNLGQAGTVGGSLNDLTVVNGNLTLGGTLNVTTSTGGTFDAGVYRIISYAGSLTNNGLVLGSLPSGANATLQTSVAGQINLINNYAGTTFWDGATGHNNSAIDGGTGIWNTGVGANSNWTDGSGAANSAYSTNFAVFQGTPGTVTVDNSQGQVAVTGMQFMTDGYRINGDEITLNETTANSGYSIVRVGDGTAAGSSYTATIDSILGGLTGLSKTDLGTLILTGSNTYSGGTNISGGTLQLGDGTTNGSIQGNVANAGTLALKPASGTTMALSGVISGAGALRMIGDGTAILTGANTWTGGTTISSGTLQIGDGTTNGVLPGNVVNNAALAFMPTTGSTLNYGGVISGTGSVTQKGQGTTVFTASNTYTGGTTISSGVLQLGDGTANNDGSIAGNVTNNGTLAFRFNGSKTVANQISGSGGVSQLSGTTTLSGVNTYTGGTTLNGGLLSVSNDNNLGNVSGRLTFNGGQLQTNATIARDILVNTSGGKIFSNGGTFSGNISGTGTLEFQGGTTYITGNNTSSGGIILSEYGTVVINSANALGTGKITGRSQDSVYGGGGNLRTTASMTLANDVDFGFTSFYGSGNQQSVGFITDAGTTLTMTGNFNQVGGYRDSKGISKSGAGTMVLANTSYQDGGYALRVYAGTLIVGDGGTRGTIGAAPVRISSGAALKFNRSDTYLYSGSMSGAGSFEQIGTGTSVLTGNNTHTGGTTISAGTLQLGNGGTSGWVSGDITNNGTLAFNRSDNVTWSNLISGTGALSKLGTGTLSLTGTQTYTGGTTITSGILQLGDGTTDGSIVGNVNMAGGTLAFNASNGSMTDQNALISGAGSLTKLGLGTTVLTGANTYTGATTVSAGALYIDGNQSAATGATTVASGATLGGMGTIGGNVTIANGATLMPGSENGTGGTLTINGNLALNDLSNLNYQFGSVNGVVENTRTDVNGNLTLDGRLNVTTPTGGTFSAGVYRVFNYNGTLTNNGLVLGTVPAGTTLALQSSVPGQVNLVNSTGQLLAFWDGMNSGNYNQGSGEGGTGTWRLLGQTAWADASGSSNSAYGNKSFAVFSGTAGTVTVDNTSGQIESSGIQFTTDGYLINGGAITLVNSPVDGSSPVLRVGDGSDASSNMTATIASVLQGATSVTKTDLGTLVLTGTNTWTGGTRINGGVLQVSSNTNLGAVAGTLSFDGGTLATTAGFTTARTTTLNANGGTLNTASGTTLMMSGVIGGSGSLSKTNTGRLVLAGTNTYTGGTAINGGIVQVSSDANLGAATGSLSFDSGTLATTESFSTARATTLNAGGGTIDTASGTTLTMSGVVGGTGALTKTNTGTLTLTNSNTWSGGTTISGGTLQLGNGGTGGSITGNVTNNGTLVFNRSDTATFAGVISGSGVVNQTGTGKTILSGNNSYSGGTTISAGTLTAQNGTALGTGAVANNAALQLDFATDGTLANVLNGSGTLSKTGSGTTTLTGTGSREGATTVSGGTLAFGQSGAFNAASLNVTSGAAITVNQSANLVLSGAYTQAAGATFNGVADTQAKTAVTAATASLNGALNITGFGIAAPATASGLTGTQYTVIHTTSGITGDFSSVNLNGAASAVDYLRLAGRVSGNDYNVGYGLSWLEGQAFGNGSFTLAGATDAFNVDVALGDQATGTYTSGWDGKTLTKAGLGVLTLSAVNTYTGDTRVNGGTLKAGIADAFAQSANVAVASGATLDLNNFNQTARNLSGAGNVTLGSATLTENAVSDTTFSGSMSGTGGLTKTGTGVFTLSGNNSYSGGTTISAGTLVAQNGSAMGTGAVANNAALRLDFAQNGTLANVLSGSGTLSKTGSGTTTLTGTGSNQGATTVSGGTLAFAQSGAFNAASLNTATGASTRIDQSANVALSGALTQAAGASLLVAKGTQPAVTAQTANLNGTLSLTGYSTATPASASGLTGTQYTVIRTTNGITGDFSSVNLNGAASAVDYLRLAGRVSGNDYNVGYGLSWREGLAYGNGSFTLAGAADAFNVDVALGDQATGTYTSGWDGKTLTKAGLGVLTLSAVNTYTGDTRVNGGTLKAGIADAFAQSANVAVASGATLDLNNFNQTARNLSGAGNVTLGSATLTENAVSDTTFSGSMSGTGGLTKAGTGVFTLSGNNSYSGGTTISSGTLVAQNGSAMGTGAVANNAALRLDFAQNGTLANVLSGSGTLSKTGSGTTTLTGTGSNQGATTVSGGTLAFGQSGAFNAASLNTATGASTRIDQSANVVLSGALTQAAGASLLVAKGTQPAVTAQTANLNGTLSLTGYSTAAPASASGLTGTQYTVVRTTNGITGDFSSVNLNGAASAVDYLRLAGRVSGNDYNVGYGLSWLEGQAFGNGSFTLAGATDAFNVDVALGDQATGTYTSGWDGKTLTKAGLGVLTLSAVNTYTGDTRVNGGTLKAGIANAFAQSANVAVASGATLDLNNFNQTARNLSGAGNVTLGSATLTENAVSDTTFSGTMSGTGGLTKTGTGVFTLSGNNSYSGGTTISAGTLQLGNGGTSGAIVGNVLNNGALTFNRSDATTFANVISGSGRVTQVGTGKTIFTATHTYSGGTTISAGTLQLGNGGTTGSVQGAIDIASGATLAVDWGADYTLNNTLTGSGLVAVKAAGNDVNFASAATGAGFSGTVDLQNAVFSLGGVNTGALTAATLRLGSNSVTTVADGTQSIGGLAIDGGKVIFNATVPAQVDATSLVQANTLDASGAGTVQVTLPTPYVLPTPPPSTDLSLLEQDDVNVLTRLVSTSSATGSGGALSLQDQNGNTISAAQQINVQQDGNLVALGTYDYRLSTGTSQDGLYVSYGLKQLDLQNGQTLTLAERDGATGASADMSAKITGSGSLRVDAGTGVLSLSNTTNDFTGDTTVAAGTLQADARNVIATSANVAVNAGATLDTHGYHQSLTNLTGAGTVTNSTTTATTLTLNDTATSVFSGTITGTQLALVQATGTQVLTGSNTYGGGTTINTAATLQLGNGGTTGSITGNVTNNGALAFNRSDTVTFTGVIAGSGAINQMGTGRTILTGVNSYSGGTTISAGTLQLGNGGTSGAITGNVANNGVLAFNHSDTATFAGVISGTGAVNQMGSGSTILTGNNSYSGGTTISAGTLQLGDGGTTGSITGNVTNNGALTFNRSDETTFSGVISGSGHVTQMGAGKTLFTGTHTYSGDTTISAGTLQLGNGGTTGSVQGAIDIASGATLAVDWGADYTLNNTLTGSGLVAVTAAGNNVNFATAAMGAGFSGTVDLQNATFNLGGENTGALAAATLRSGSGSAITVADGKQSIGGLDIDGGKVIFNATVPAQVDATSLVQANTLDVSGAGTVQVVLPTSYELPTQAPSTELSLLEQDDVNLGTRLVSATTTTGNAGALSLQDQNGNVLSAGQQINVQQGGNLVALGTYDYRLSTGTRQDGLYVSYGLKQLDLQNGQTLTLAQNSGATGASADMSAKVTGSGSLRVDAGSGILSLSNTTNDFTGDTTVAAGTLQAGALNVIATSANVAVNADATLDTNGYHQSLTNLTGAGTVTNGTTTAITLTLNDTATSVFAGAITGEQLALVQATGTQVLAGNNTYGGGTTINTAATLQLGDGGTTGSITGNVTNDGALAFNRSDSATFSGVISGSGVVNQTGTGRTILSGVNSYSGGTTISAGTLQLNGNQGAGTGAISINTEQGNAGTGLELAFTDVSDFSNQLTGTGTTTVSGAQATITAANTAYTGNWRVTDTGTLAVTTDAVSSTDNLGSGGVDIAAGGVVNALTQGAFSFNNALTGAGTLNASGHGQAFSFGSAAGSAFTGTAVLTDNTFSLSGDNTTALTHGKLSVGSGNVTTVGDGNQQIGGLIINDGKVMFNATAPDEILATSLITADTLDISHTGTVYINAPASYVPQARDTNNSLNLLMQDEINTGVQLVKSTTVTGSGGAIQLLNKDGSTITAARKVDINQNGNLVARGTYDYRVTSGADSDGLYVNYGLTELDLQAGKTLTLAQDTGATNASADMSAKVTGSGTLAVDADTGVVSLSNANNDYTGETTVSSGTLRAAADNALGKTRLLTLAGNTGFDLNGKTQTVGELNGAAGSSLNLNGGTFALSNGGLSAGTLTGAGKINILGGTFDVRGANTGLSAITQISKGATASLNNVAGLGSGNIVSDGTLALDGATGTMSNNISGTGELVKKGDGEVVLTGKTGWTGTTRIDGGDLVLDGSRGGAQLVSNIIAKDNTSLSLRHGATLTGWIDPTDVNIDSVSRWNMTADSLVDDVNLAGTINFVAPSSQSMTKGHTLTATNWHGQDGTVILNSVLGGDKSATDKLVINGNTSGNTFVKINNLGGRGAQTVEGIQVVDVGGQSNGTFTKSGRIVAGIYDYSLVKKGKDWYLTSKDTSTPKKKGTSGVRPESASYTANLAAANTMFVHRLHDRAGETQYTDALTGEQKVTSMWLRQVGGHNRWSDSSGQLDTQSNRYVTQLGGEIAQWSPDGVQGLHLGVMAGYGRNSSNSHSGVTGYSSDGSVNGYSTGLYATWYQNDETKQGMYLDSWAQYGWFDNTVKGEKVQSESYKSKGVTTSLELGYTHKLGNFTGSQGTEGEWYIQPQAQAIWMGVKADEHHEDNGTRVTGEGDDNVQTRLGVRTFLKSHSKLDEGKNRNFEPYVEINWIHNTQSFGTRMDGSSLSQDGARNTGEVKAGVEGQLNSRLSVWGNVGVQVGDKGYSDTSATLGVKYNF